MELNEYQQKAAEFAQYASEAYPFYGLMEEVGELMGILAKTHRGDDMVARYGSIRGVREAVIKEAGDVLWMLSQVLRELDLSLEEVARANLEKLSSRLERGVIKGAGDDR